MSQGFTVKKASFSRTPYISYTKGFPSLLKGVHMTNVVSYRRDSVLSELQRDESGSHPSNVTPTFLANHAVMGGCTVDETRVQRKTSWASPQTLELDPAHMGFLKRSTQAPCRAHANRQD